MKVIDMDNVLELKTVNQLQEFSFFIPGYQRGYKWGLKEIKELLNDISDFLPRLINESDDKTWYCLQPVIVKARGDNTYEVIDGQQRLTTLYLILYYLNQDFVESRRDKLFELKYETRDDSSKYLVHVCLEGPEAAVYYRGKGEITNNNSVVIYLPDYVKNLATDFKRQPEKGITGIPTWLRVAVLDAKHPGMTYYLPKTPALKEQPCGVLSFVTVPTT